jgi:hypothetical protein
VVSSKLNINEEMRAIDCRDFAWWDNLTKDEQAVMEKQMWIQMRWASCVDGANTAPYLMIVNDFTNLHFNSLRHHPQLQHRLLQLAGAGTKQRRDWIAPGKKGKKNKLAEWLMTQYPTLNDAELELMIATNTKEDLVDVMEQQGMTTKEIKDLFK